MATHRLVFHRQISIMLRMVAAAIVFVVTVAPAEHAMPQTASTETPLGLLRWQRLPDLPNSLGVAGPYVGTHRGAVIVAGGANFPANAGEDRWSAAKVWHDDVWVMAEDENGGYEWKPQQPLPRPMAYGATASTPLGTVCIGGEDGKNVFDSVLLLSWSQALRRLDVHSLPKLPQPMCFGGAAAIGSEVYVACGQCGPDRLTATAAIFRLELHDFHSSSGGTGSALPKWERLPDVPGGPRTVPIVIARSGSTSPRLCVMSGRRPDPASGDAAIEIRRDAYEFDPSAWEASGKKGLSAVGWKRLADMPASRMAGTALAISPTHLVVLSGDDGRLFTQTNALKDAHPGFPRACLVYDASGDEWSLAGDAPTCQLATTTAPWDGGWVMVSGEIRPRVRTPAVWRITAPAGAAGNGATK